MNEQEKENTTKGNESNLTDLEPADDVKGGSDLNGHNAGALRNVTNTNTY